MGYGREIRSQFAKAYAKVGNATHALRMVLGEERAGRMKPHTLRAKASELLNHYRVAEQIEQEKAEMQQRGETLPHYRLRTWRADLISDEVHQPIEPPADRTTSTGFYDSVGNERTIEKNGEIKKIPQ